MNGLGLVDSWQFRGAAGTTVAAAMLRTREMVDADIAGDREIVPAPGIRRVQRHQRLPVLGVGHGRRDLRAGLALAAALELAGGDAGDRIVALVPALRRFLARELLLGVLRPRQPRRLREADVEGAAVGGFVRDRSLEHLASVHALVEAELQEGAVPAPALG